MVNENLAEFSLRSYRVCHGALLVVVSHEFNVRDGIIQVNYCPLDFDVHMSEVNMQMVVGWLVVEVGLDFARIKVPLGFNCLETFVPNRFQHWQVFSSQVSNRLQVFLKRHDQTIHRPDVTFVEFVVLCKNEFFILEHDVFLFFLAIED